MNIGLEIDRLRGWVGVVEEASDILTPALVDRFHATFGLPEGPAAAGRNAPRFIHFCLCQTVSATLGKDGHPARGGFLPPVPLPRRMWAASEIRLKGDLLVGEAVRRRSRVAEVEVKDGRTGPLCFVTVDHEFFGERGAVIRDRQTIVYGGAGSTAPPASTVDPAPHGDTVETLELGPVPLFRYSALTFNAHRIHYDRDYAVGIEGYPGLVVHGPLQATLLFQLATRLRGDVPPDRFAFRSVSPVFDRDRLSLHAGPVLDGTINLWTVAVGGSYAMRAQARWS